MKKFMLVVLLAVGFAMQYVQAAEPLARITPISVSIAAGHTNGAQNAWLDTGEPVGMKTAGNAGQVRAIFFYAADTTVTNWTFNLYAYDGGHKKLLYGASGTTAAPTTGRYDLLSTNVVFSGRVRGEAFYGYTNTTASAVVWGVILE